MTRKDDSKTALRSSYYRRGLRSAKFQFPMGNIGIFMQVTLAIIYMYLILLGYQMMGVAGVALVSGLFLLALFSPIIFLNSLRMNESVWVSLGIVLIMVGPFLAAGVLFILSDRHKAGTEPSEVENE